MQFELHKRYTLTEVGGEISTAGIRAIETHLYYEDLMRDEWKGLNNTYHRLPALPDWWEWVWVVTQKGEYTGTFAKRVRKFYHKVYGIHCPNAFIERLGGIARAHSSSAITHSFDFTDSLTWESGAFGDHYSCLWGTSALEDMMDGGVWAIRFYEDDAGIARAWLYDTGNYYILWNGYGFASQPTLTIARIFAKFVNASYKKIWLTNNGTSDGAIYINNGSGYAIGALETIEDIRSDDLEIGESFYGYCEHCGRTLYYEDDAYYVDPHDYCEDCYHNLFATCDVCGETYDADDTQYIDQRVVCDDCLERDYTRCEQCGEWTRNEQTITVGADTFCEACYSKLPEPPESED